MNKINSTSKMKDRLIELGSIFEILEEWKGSQCKILVNKTTCEHSPFYVTPNNILKVDKSNNHTYDCPVCANIRRTESKRKSSSNSLEVFKEVLNNKILYPNNDYILIEGQTFLNNKQNLRVMCDHCNKEFKLSLVNARQGRKCPNCRNSRIRRNSQGCTIIERWLSCNGINFEREKSFEWLVFKRKMFLDFYLPDYNLAIEFDGQQHFKETIYSTKEDLKTNMKRDSVKNKLCKKNGLKLLRIKYSDNIEHVLSETFNDYQKH